MKNLEVWLFLFIAFFLGTWGALFNIVQTVLIGAGLLFNVVKYREEFVRNFKSARFYVLIPLFYMVYLALQTVILVLSDKYDGFKPRYGIFEPEFFFFLLGILYVLSAKAFVTLRLLKSFLWVFCLSVFSFNLFFLFYLSGTDLFTHTAQAVERLYQSRFGFTKVLWGGEVYLDAQALQIYAAALIACFFGITQHKYMQKGIAFLLFVILVWFLSLTVTKSSILSFLCGFLVLNFYFLRKLTLKWRWGLVCCLCLIVVCGYIFRPASFDRRWQEMEKEIEDVRSGKLSGGSSIVPRVVFYKSCFEHLDEFAWGGLGVYTNPVSKQWYLNSGNACVAGLTHSHNSYLQYWMLGGIIGLCYILSWFVRPFLRMVRKRQFAFLPLALMLAFFIDANFEVLLIVSDAIPLVIFFLAMFYLYQDEFFALENSKF